MAYIPSRQSLGRMNQARNQRVEELGKALNSLGGVDPALTTNYARNNPLPTASIPVLEQAVIDTYNNGNRNTRQQIAPTYEDVRNTQVQRALDSLGQTDLLRGTNSSIVESIKNPGEGMNALERYINTPYTAGNTIKNAVNDLTEMFSDRVNELPGIENIYGGATFGKQIGDFAKQNGQPTITPELQALGFTEQDLRRWRDAQNETERQEVLSQFAKDHPVISTVNSIPENAIGSIANVERQIQDYVTNQPLRERQTNADIMRGAVSEEIDSNAGRFAYNVGNSIADMALATLLSGGTAPVASSIMGMEKGNQTMNSAINRGLTPNQIMGEGVLSGVSTALTEAIPLEGIINGSSIWRSIFSEGLQEASEDIVDTAFDQLITGLGGNHEKSELRQDYNAYISAGYDKNEALKAVAVDYVKQLAMDAVAGGISGGVLGAGSNIVQGRNAITGRIPTLNTETVTETNNEAKAEENQRIITELQQQVEGLKDNMNPDAWNNIIDRVDEVADTIPELSPQLREIVSNMDSLRNNIPENVRQEIAAQNATTIPNELLQETQANEYNDTELLNEGINQRDQQINAIADEVTAEKNKVIEGLDRSNPYAGESVYNFSKYINEMKQNYPNMAGYLDAELNDVLNMSQDWITDFDNINVEIPSILPEQYQAEIQNVENEAAFDQANKIVDAFENDVMNGNVDRQTAYKGVLADLIRLGNYYPNIQGRLNQLLRDRLNPIMSRPLPVLNEQTETQPVKDTRPQIERDFESEVNDIMQRISDGNITLDEYIDFNEKAIKDISKIKNKEISDRMNRALYSVANAYNNSPSIRLPLETDLRSMSTAEELQGAVDEALASLPKGSYKYNLHFFGGPIDAEEDMGRVETGRYKTSKFYPNTAEKSGNLTDKQRAMHEADDSMLWEENSEKESVSEAHSRLANNGYDNEYTRLMDKNGFTNVDTDEAMMIWRYYSDEAVRLDEKGLESDAIWQKVHDITDKIQNEGSLHASALQALAKWSRNNTPEGLLAQAGSIIRAAENGYNGYKATENGWYKQIQSETKGNTKQMDLAFIKNFLTEARKLDGLDIDSREAKHIMANLGKMVNSQIPVTLREKVVTLLMDNMLGNFRTLITRNAGGNIGFNLMEQLARKPLSALIDSAISKKRGTPRTVSGLTKVGVDAYKAGALEAIGQEIYDFTNNIQSARSGENNLHTATGNNRQIFNNKNVLGKIGNFYNKLVKAGLSAGDRLFYEGVYDESMAEYRKMFKEGKFGDLSEEKFEQLAKTHARLNALEAVYQDDSKMAQSFLKMKQAVNELSQGVVGADVLSQFTMPFVKTPANIIERAIEYSPVGLIKNAVQTIREVNHAVSGNKMLDFNQERFATETARNIIGSALFAIAIGMAHLGKLTGGYSEDKDMRQAQKEAGMQEYALHNPLGMNADVDISWIPVLGNNMVAAASAYDAASKPELTAGQSIGQGLTAGLKSQFESSMLQGLQRFFGGSGTFGSDGGDLLTNAVDTIKSGGTQLIPSLLRQTANASDPYQRQLAGPNPDDYYLNSILSAVPGLRQNLEPKISRTGEPLEQNHAQTLGGRILNNFINPATVTYGTPDAVRDEAMRLFDATQGDNRAFEPTVTMSELKVDNHVPTAQEYTQYQQAAYGAMNQAAQQMINSEAYANMSDSDKVNILAELYSAIKTVEKKNILGLDKSGLNGADKAYNEGGIDGLVEYMTVRNYLGQMGLQNNEKNRNEVLQALNEGGTQAVEQMVSQTQQMQDMGFDTNMINRYNHASQYIPSLTPTSFEDTFRQIDQQNEGESGYGSIKQSEIIDFLNQNPTEYTDEDAMQYWNAFLQTYSKIPVLNDKGVWEAKKV